MLVLVASVDVDVTLVSVDEVVIVSENVESVVLDSVFVSLAVSKAEIDVG